MTQAITKNRLLATLAATILVVVPAAWADGNDYDDEEWQKRFAGASEPEFRKDWHPDYRYATGMPKAHAAETCPHTSATCGSQGKSAQGKELDTAAARAADHALKLVGKPYRYGGSSPSSGFDASGLVHYSFGLAGAAVPRSAEELRSASALVTAPTLHRGDLLFFDEDGKNEAHVAIYLGAGEFIHALSSGGRVRRDRLCLPYWKQHLSQARRLDI